LAELTRQALALALMTLQLPACVHSYGLETGGVSSPGRRTALFMAVNVRSDLRLPRTYAAYAGTELTAASQLYTSGAQAGRAEAGQGQPSARLGLNAGFLRVPTASERFGWRLGLRGGVWHGALGDDSARWALDVGAEAAPMLRLGPTPTPWASDETLSLVSVIIPTLSGGPLLRLDPNASARLDYVYAFTLSLGFHLSSAVIP
jgi:hypothetical protein